MVASQKSRARKISRGKHFSIPSDPLSVVGIGASAGGLAAVTELLKDLPGRLGVAIVLVQHLDPKHESLTVEILSRTSSMPVTQATEGTRIQPAHVYVIPPNHNLSLKHGVLKLSPRIENRGPHMPIDFFLRSLADDKKDLSIGVILSGMASDGTEGLKAIKAAGGVTFAQEPKSAQYDGMPRSAISSGAVDIVKTPKGIAEEIRRIAPFLPPKTFAGEGRAAGPDANLEKIFRLVRNATGADFTHYKFNTIQRRIRRRLIFLKLPDLMSYVRYLEGHPEETKQLFEEMLIPVTGFFRDPEAFHKLKTQIVPRFLKDRAPETSVRVWVPGCSTGEEAYSIAMVYFENLGELSIRPRLQIFASDISEEALQKARAAVYPESISSEVSSQRLQRFFEKTEKGYRIAKSIRETCLFSRQDVTGDPPFAKMDLISCRNVLIYFTSELQKRVIRIFHYCSVS